MTVFVLFRLVKLTYLLSWKYLLFYKRIFSCVMITSSLYVFSKNQINNNTELSHGPVKYYVMGDASTFNCISCLLNVTVENIRSFLQC